MGVCGCNGVEAIWRTAVFVGGDVDRPPNLEIHPRGEGETLTPEAPELSQPQRRQLVRQYGEWRLQAAASEV